MKRAAYAVAVVLLVVIGAVEASVSAQQLAEAAGRPRLESTGVVLSATGLLASAAVYLTLGYLAVDDGAALRLGTLTGLFAGLIGGTVRAWIIGGVVAEFVARYAAVPEWFVQVALGVFVVLSCAVSAVGGGAIAWTGRRLSRALWSRPPA